MSLSSGEARATKMADRIAHHRRTGGVYELPLRAQLRRQLCLKQEEGQGNRMHPSSGSNVDELVRLQHLQNGRENIPV